MLANGFLVEALLPGLHMSACVLPLGSVNERRRGGGDGEERQGDERRGRQHTLHLINPPIPP